VKLALAAAAVASTVGGWAALARAQQPFDAGMAAVERESGGALPLAIEALALDLPPVPGVEPLAPLGDLPAIDPLPPLVRAIEPPRTAAGSGPGAGPAIPVRPAGAPAANPAPPPARDQGAAPAGLVAPASAAPAAPPAPPAPAAAATAPVTAAPRIVVVPTPKPATGKVAATTRSSR
jgi:hypothetical protein